MTGSASLPYASGSEIACLDFEITIKENGSTSKYYEQKKAASDLRKAKVTRGANDREIPGS